MKNFFLLLSIVMISFSCKKYESPDSSTNIIANEVEDKYLVINDSIKIDNRVVIHDSIFNYNTYKKFLLYLLKSNRFLIVSQRDFEKTSSKDKVILSIRHDVDDNINSAIKFAYREHKLGIVSTYFILHTAKYYGETRENYFNRNNNLLPYLKKIQDFYNHEIGFHNDLVTLQVVYNIDPKRFLKNELSWLRINGINIYGSAAHGSEYCYIYRYTNNYFWKEYTSGGSYFYNFEFFMKNDSLIKIEKDNFSNYDLEYESGKLKTDHFFSDSFFINGKRWNMGMKNFDSFKPGEKIILLLHPQHWD